MVTEVSAMFVDKMILRTPIRQILDKRYLQKQNEINFLPRGGDSKTDFWDTVGNIECKGINKYRATKKKKS